MARKVLLPLYFALPSPYHTSWFSRRTRLKFWCTKEEQSKQPLTTESKASILVNGVVEKIERYRAVWIIEFNETHLSHAVAVILIEETGRTRNWRHSCVIAALFWGKELRRKTARVNHQTKRHRKCKPFWLFHLFIFALVKTIVIILSFEVYAKKTAMQKLKFLLALYVQIPHGYLWFVLTAWMLKWYDRDSWDQNITLYPRSQIGKHNRQVSRSDTKTCIVQCCM